MDTPHDDRGHGGLAVRLLPAATFVVGAVLGGVVVAVGDSDATAPDEPASTSTTPEPGVTVSVPQACEDAALAVSEAVEQIRAGSRAVRDLDPDAVVDVLNRLEDLDPQIRSLSQRCSQVQVEQGGDTG